MPISTLFWQMTLTHFVFASLILAQHQEENEQTPPLCNYEWGWKREKSAEKICISMFKTKEWQIVVSPLVCRKEDSSHCFLPPPPLICFHRSANTLLCLHLTALDLSLDFYYLPEFFPLRNVPKITRVSSMLTRSAHATLEERIEKKKEKRRKNVHSSPILLLPL